MDMGFVMHHHYWILLCVNIIALTLFYFNVRHCDHSHWLRLPYQLFWGTAGTPPCIRITAIVQNSICDCLVRNLSLSSTQQQKFPFSTRDLSLLADCQNTLNKNLKRLPLDMRHHLSLFTLSLSLSLSLSLTLTLHSSLPSTFPRTPFYVNVQFH